MTIESQGEGLPTLMLYGLSGTSNNFQAMVSALASFRLVRPDLPGASRSPQQAEKADHRLIDCPALIVTGDEDAVGPPSLAWELADKIGGAKTVILNRCGHWTPVEKSRECGKLLSEFVRGIPVEEHARRCGAAMEEASWPTRRTV